MRVEQSGGNPSGVGNWRLKGFAEFGGQ